MTEPAHEDLAGSPLSGFVLTLQEFRVEKGLLSYNEIALRISNERRDRGMSQAEARVARTTVYDAFRPERIRLNPELVGEIVRALGCSADEAQTWVTACSRVQAGTPAPSGGDSRARGVVSSLFRSVPVVLVLSVAVNLLGTLVVHILDLPLYLDMTGTAMSSVLLGPWWGALVGLATNVGETAFGNTWAALSYGVVNIVGALVWGYGVRRFGWGRSLPRFFVLSLLVGLVCTAISAPISLAFFGDDLAPEHHITAHVMVYTHTLAVSVFSANLVTSLADKLISGFIAVMVTEAIGRPIMRARQTIWP